MSRASVRAVGWAARAGAALTGLLLIVGCGPLDTKPSPTSTQPVSDLRAVVVTGVDGDKPVVTVPTPFSVPRTMKLVLRSGTGAAVKAGQRVTIHYVGVNGTDGKEFVTDYGKRATTFVLTAANNLKGMVNGLVGVPIGSRVALAIPPSDAFGLDGRPQANIGPTDTLVIVVDIQDAKDVLTKAVGSPVPAKPGLPTVARDAAGKPKITLPATRAGTTLVVQPLILGAGAKVAQRDQVRLQYVGVIWPGGKQFDASWGVTPPASFVVGDGRLIAGLDEGLVGQTVGSEVLVIVPPDKGYGAAGFQSFGIKGTDTLVFVVDILDTAKPGATGG